ncbi:molybdopterin molybdotransferase MoeA [Streptomyces polyrhachis]|uniref:Molybdopterin molybdenumtransferase n=1 Tax=Streptomyces polyrhachis TaxID=1282885 RepID=A0ABW2GJ44_9ACTN
MNPTAPAEAPAAPGRTRTPDSAHHHRSRTTWDEAHATARTCAPAPLPAVAHTLADALGCALARPLAALTDLPSFDTSAMDGWAVAGPGPWRLHGAGVLAGAHPAPLEPRTAVPIATGAPVPAGATAVLRREHGLADAGTLHLTAPRPLAPRGDIRPRGQECAAGEALLPAGTPVTPAVLGLAAAAGYDRLPVHRRPTVDVLLLGDELLHSGLPRAGRVRDALGPMLPPWLERTGARVRGVQPIPDELDALQRALAATDADVVVTTGSTAAGPVDFLHTALARAGARLLVDSVAVRPGHPMLLAHLPPAPDGRARRLVGLPGNPLAAVAGVATLAAPLLTRLAGHREAPLRTTPAAVALPGHPHDTRLLPVHLTPEGATPAAFDGPAMLRGLTLADALAVVPPGGAAQEARVRLLGVPR